MQKARLHWPSQEIFARRKISANRTLLERWTSKLSPQVGLSVAFNATRCMLWILEVAQSVYLLQLESTLVHEQRLK